MDEQLNIRWFWFNYDNKIDHTYKILLTECDLYLSNIWPNAVQQNTIGHVPL